MKTVDEKISFVYSLCNIPLNDKNANDIPTNNLVRKFDSTLKTSLEFSKHKKTQIVSISIPEKL